MKKMVPIHIGLVGHIDHGKTELARALSEKVSTAGLDKHPQAKQRGITIDLGFTMFTLGDFLVTLVDAPGHADLIRSVVAGASIIDAAILVVAADEGAQIQTGEHVVVLKSMGIENLLVAITKTDTVDAPRIDAVERQMKDIIEGARITNVDFVKVSAKTGDGLENLRDVLLSKLESQIRQKDGPFLMPIDHAFTVKGHGTVVTGTVLRGRLSTDDTIQLSPQGDISRVRSIQTFGEDRAETSAGDRVGLNVPDIDYRLVRRGNYVTEPDTLPHSRNIIVSLQRNGLYRGRFSRGLILSATVGMPTVTAELVPLLGGTNVMLEETADSSLKAALLFQEDIPVDIGTRVLLMRTDLPPTQMRIIGSGEVIEIPENLVLKRSIRRTGRVSRIRTDDVLVEGLASSKEIAESISGSQVQTQGGVKGTLKQPFGTRGVVSVQFESPVEDSEEVIYERFVEEEISFGYRRKTG
ncbi:MAG: selenocysteine-specific translation elongation factor [Candidatus Thorarchaeota archaeon]|jgi:selenocysteine-specific elongation factor